MSYVEHQGRALKHVTEVLTKSGHRAAAIGGTAVLAHGLAVAVVSTLGAIALQLAAMNDMTKERRRRPPAPPPPREPGRGKVHG